MTDGATHEVACFVPGAVAEIPQVECPHPFVNPLAMDHVESCIQPCPVQAYNDGEYTFMWGLSMGVGLVGFALNLFMGAFFKWVFPLLTLFWHSLALLSF
jgi:hypothetical protein